MELDAVDQDILGLLARDARISNKNLAQRVGLSESACLERVRKLERKHVIRGYHAEISTNGKVEAWADVSLANLDSGTCATFLRVLFASRVVAAVYQTAGAYDYLIRFVAPDVLQWRHLASELQTIGIGPERVRFSLVIERLKWPANAHIQPEAEGDERKDRVKHAIRE